MSKRYTRASHIIQKVVERKGGLKSLTFTESADSFTKSIYALVCETLKYKEVIVSLARTVKFEKEYRKKKKLKWLYCVMIYDLLIGKGNIEGGGSAKKTIMKYRIPFMSALARLKISKGVSENSHLLPKHFQNQLKIPRYARINTIKASKSEVTDIFMKDGWKFGESQHSSNSVDEKKVAHFDVDIPNLIVFPHGTDIHDHQLVKEGKVILQDKASCIPAVVLSPPSHWHIIDSCAAPGNKTSHLATFIANSNRSENTKTCGKIDAFEIDKKRHQLLESQIKKFGADDIVSTHCKSFLKVDPKDEKFANVRGIIVDPSCSGSGIIHQRLDHLVNQKENGQQSENSEEVKNLAQFQKTILSHALEFPMVEKVVYSTCSVHRAENEDVVSHVMEKYDDFDVIPAMPSWKRRGLENVFSKGSCCLRTDPKEDLTSGFFVALFERKKREHSQTPAQSNTQDPSSIKRTKRKKSRRKKKKSKRKRQQMDQQSADNKQNEQKKQKIEMKDID